MENGLYIGIGTGVLIGLGVGIFFAVKSARRTITYKEIMNGFIEKKKVLPAAVRGSILKEGERGHYVITQAFLDEKGEVIDGWKIKAFDLDNELQALFKTNNLVVVE
jgi:hypothetical protein